MRLRKSLVMLIYLLFVLVPIYWLVNMSLKSNREILGGLTLWPAAPTLAPECVPSATRLPSTEIFAVPVPPS